MCAFVGLLAVGASWAAAYFAVGDLLVAPPPNMGNQVTTLFWKGVPELSGHPRAWRFAFGPTLIPGAPEVRIYVTPTGQVIRTEPADLAARIYALHHPKY
jgi:hypothetical protein